MTDVVTEKKPGLWHRFVVWLKGGGWKWITGAIILVVLAIAGKFLADFLTNKKGKEILAHVEAAKVSEGKAAILKEIAEKELVESKVLEKHVEEHEKAAAAHIAKAEELGRRSTAKKAAALDKRVEKAGRSLADIARDQAGGYE